MNFSDFDIEKIALICLIVTNALNSLFSLFTYRRTGKVVKTIPSTVLPLSQSVNSSELLSLFVKFFDDLGKVLNKDEDKEKEKKV